MNTITLKFPPLDAPTLPILSRLFAWINAPKSAQAAAPAPKRPLTRAQEAAPVREMAWRVRATDPGFSADLYAAAARHEGLDDL
jgi:hypothetical protein